MSKRTPTSAISEAEMQVILDSSVIAFPNSMLRGEVMRALVTGMIVAQTLAHMVDRFDDRSNDRAFK
jgi:hypothetical protein